jgi:Zn-dependent protease with chaperone function
VIRALVALYEKTNSPARSNRIVELFESHPSLAHRVQAIADAAELPWEKVSEFLSRVEPVLND